MLQVEGWGKRGKWFLCLESNTFRCVLGFPGTHALPREIKLGTSVPRDGELGLCMSAVPPVHRRRSLVDRCLVNCFALLDTNHSSLAKYFPIRKVHQRVGLANMGTVSNYQEWDEMYVLAFMEYNDQTDNFMFHYE